jgi:transcriptional regulator with XRE-family HTH domain
VDSIRFGLSIRALRRRLPLTQKELGRRARVSQSLIARVERGRADRVTPAVLQRICAALGARLTLRVDWQGEALDHLLDADHAALVEQIVRILRAAGWHCLVEVTFAVDRERGSIDILALHETTGTLLVIEAKSTIPDIQAMLAALDRKVRLGPSIARERGWRPATVGAILVVAEGRTNRRRVQAVEATFATHLPARSAAVRRYLAQPSGPIRGLWFVPISTQATGRHRIGWSRTPFPA